MAFPRVSPILPITDEDVERFCERFPHVPPDMARALLKQGQQIAAKYATCVYSSDEVPPFCGAEKGQEDD